MKSLAKVVVAFLLAVIVTVAFGSFKSHINAAPELCKNVQINPDAASEPCKDVRLSAHFGPDLPINVKIDERQTLEDILNLVKYQRKFTIQIVNQTPSGIICRMGMIKILIIILLKLVLALDRKTAQLSGSIT